MMSKKSHLEKTFTNQLKALGIKGYQNEYPFTYDIVGAGKGVRQRLKDRGLKAWRFDFAWPNIRLAIELNGGTYTNGRHNRGSSLYGEYMKLNAANEHGWTVLIFDSKMVKNGFAINQTEKIIEREFKKLSKY